MSLLQSALGRGLEQLGDTASRGVLYGMKAKHDEEMEAARALRAENLARLQHQWHREDRQEDYLNKGSGVYDPDNGTEWRNRDLEEPDENGEVYDRNSGISKAQAEQNLAISTTHQLNGLPATNQQIAENAEANKNVGLLQSAARKRAEAAIGSFTDKPDMSDEERQKLLEQGEYTPEEQESYDSWKASAGTVSDTKKDAAATKAELEMSKLEQKLAAQKEIMESKIASAQQIADAKLEMAKTIAQIKALKGSAYDHEGLADRKDVQMRLRQAQRAYQTAVKGGDDDAIEAALQDIDSLNEDAVKVGVTPLKVGKHSKQSSLDALEGDGQQMPIPAKGQQPKAAKPLLAAAKGSADIDSQAQDAIMKVNADRTLSTAQKQAKINAIQQRRNQLIGG